jgi:HTH-type transcriptional regulator / antitoxin HigA
MEGRIIRMSIGTLDERRYEKLLKARPVVIRSEAEYQRLLGIVKDLMDIPNEVMSEEEGRLLELLGMVVEEYEDRVHPLPKVESHAMLRYLLDEKQMKPSDLQHILPRSRVSEVLSGKRSISKTQAKQLAELFHTSVGLYI